VPPAAERLKELPSLPAMVTVVALVAVTVRVEGLPAETDAGLAAMLTVGAVMEPVKLVPPHPVNANGSVTEAIVQKHFRPNNSRTRALCTVFSFRLTERALRD
jgi:hypothetical protein